MYYLRFKMDVIHDGTLVARKGELYEVTNYKKGQYTFIAVDNKVTIMSKGNKFGMEIITKESVNE